MSAVTPPGEAYCSHASLRARLPRVPCRQLFLMAGRNQAGLEPCPIPAARLMAAQGRCSHRGVLEECRQSTGYSHSPILIPETFCLSAIRKRAARRDVQPPGVQGHGSFGTTNVSTVGAAAGEKW